MSVEVTHNWAADQWDWPLQHNDGIVKVISTKDKFEVSLEAHHFTPNEIQVKVVGNYIQIHLEHQERKDQHGSVTRTVTRTYTLPDDVDQSTLKSHLSNRGVLTITAAKKH